jgi:Rap1a immunity proteins
MRNVGSWLLAAGMIVAAGQVRAEGPKLDSTADLVAYCDTEGPVGEVRDGQNFCDGFIAGSGLLYLELVQAGTMKKIACAEPIPTLAQARDAFVTWASANPDHLSGKPIDGLWRAMAATYPCPK